MKKRSCKRFNIPGATLYYHYRKQFFFFIKEKFSRDYFPVLNLSKGGARFLCHQRLTPGKAIVIQLNIPDMDPAIEIMADIRWISRNMEPSYPYQTGIAFKPFGTQRNENPFAVLDFLESLEKKIKTT